MTSFIGKIGAYVEETEPWPSYQERLDQYFIASYIDNPKKVPALLSLFGAPAIRLLRD